MWLWWNVRKLKSPSARARRDAAEALGIIGSAKAIEPLIGALTDQYEGVRDAASEALRKIGGGRTIAALVPRLTNPYWDVRMRAADILGKIGWIPGDGRQRAVYAIAKKLFVGAVAEGPDAVEPLLEALKQTDVREAAAEALGQIGDIRALEPLMDAMQNDEDWAVRKAAARALGKLGDPRAVDPLLSALAEGDIREAAAEGLGGIRDLRGVAPLILSLRDPNWTVRKASAAALGKIGDLRAVAPLMNAIKDTDIRGTVAEALGDLGDARAVEPLLTALGDNIWTVREAAAGALGKIADPRATGSLCEALKDRHENVRKLAAIALGKIGGAQAVEPLIATLTDDDSSVRHLAARALILIGAPAVEALIAALKAASAEVRQKAAEALGNLNDTRAIGPLITLARTEYNARVAIFTLISEMESEARAIDSRARSVVNTLNDLVRSHPGKVGEDDQRAIARLGEALSNASFHYSAGRPDGQVPLDSAQLRALSTQDLTAKTTPG